MKRIWIVLLLITAISVCYGQNLVPNPSFEDKVQCPQTAFNLTDAHYWLNFRESPDYFNSCTGIWQVGVPANARGNQIAKEGNAYIGLVAYGRTLSNIREHAGVQLTEPLVIGTKYFIKYFVSTADTVSMDCGCNKLGARFSTVGYTQANPSPIDNFAHVYTNSIIYDKTNWVEVSGSFVADSGYEYLILGNFFDDAHTDTVHCKLPTSSAAYYYLDAVVVSSDSLYADAVFTSTHEINFNNSVFIYPNPASDFFIIKSNKAINEINLFDDTGKLVYENKPFADQVKIETKNFNNGIYFLRVSKRDNSFSSNKIIIDN